jgi:predicted RNA-binding protein associated with RNAse of E/G family
VKIYVVLPNGKFYTLDEEELKQALNNNLISKDEYNMAYLTMNKIILMIKNDFTKLYNFTNKSLENLK